MTTSMPSGSDPRTSTAPSGAVARILLYSDDATVRRAVLEAVGDRWGDTELRWLEVATHTEVVAQVDRGGFELLVLDGEADTAGGMGLCRQLKNEVYRCPPVLLLTGRPEDGWLASWSLADTVVARPLEPFSLARAVHDTLVLGGAR